MLFDVSCKQRCDFDIEFIIELTSDNQELGRISRAIIIDSIQRTHMFIRLILDLDRSTGIQLPIKESVLINISVHIMPYLSLSRNSEIYIESGQSRPFGMISTQMLGYKLTPRSSSDHIELK